MNIEIRVLVVLPIASSTGEGGNCEVARDHQRVEVGVPVEGRVVGEFTDGDRFNYTEKWTIVYNVVRYGIYG
jgi:hypothetical protein